METGSDDPLLMIVGGNPVPVSGSAAIDSGLGAIFVEEAPMEDVLEYLSTDYRGAPRRREGRKFVAIDRGAIEALLSAPLLPSVAH